jgi:bacteriocin biosynthesis cyclodehydratase domain-containing protein
VTTLRPDAALHVLDGKLAVRSPDGSLLLLDTADAATLSRQVQAGNAPTEVTDKLRKAGLLGGADLVTGTSPRLLPQRTGAVLVEGEGVAAQAAVETLADLGAAYRRTADGARPNEDIVLLALDHWDLGRIEEWNAAAAARTGQPWLVACITEARRIQLGPLVVPGETACYACYTARRLTNAWHPDALASQFESLRAAARPAAALLPPLWTTMAGRLGAWEATRFQRGLAPSSLGAAVSLSADTLESAIDPVPKAPRCEVCSRHSLLPPHEPWMPLPGGPASPPS